jgi:hypothetical protein
MFEADAALIARRPHPGRNPVGLSGIPGSVASTDRATTRHVSAQELLTITNPPAGHAGVIGVKHAERWVRQGRAFFEEGGRLRLLDRHRTALGRSLRGSSISGMGYDAVRRHLKAKEVRRIPVAQLPERPTKRRMVTALVRPDRIVVRYENRQLA